MNLGHYIKSLHMKQKVANKNSSAGIIILFSKYVFKLIRNYFAFLYIDKKLILSFNEKI